MVPATEYIDEAIQPTVRPIVSITFNGKTINSSDLNNRDQRDVDSNFVLPPTSRSVNDEELIDLERNEKIREIASSLPSNMHPSLAAKQQSAMVQKMKKQQNNWQSVKPTIIQTGDARVNRQVAVEQNQMGILMRNSMQQQQPQQSRSLSSAPTRTNDQQQMPLEFEQQQNQMIDYPEDNETDLDNLNNMTDTNDNNKNQQGGDSSSSSMMMAGNSNTNQAAKQQQTTEFMMQGRQQDNSAINEVQQPTGVTDKPTSKQKMIAMMQPQSTGTDSQQQQSGSSKQSEGRTNETLVDSTGRQAELRTTTSAPKSTTSGQQMQDNDGETPISFNQQQSTKVQQLTTPAANAGGRVELMNGRPASATGLRQQQQQATTTSARLPTLPAKSTTTTTGPQTTKTFSATTTTTASPMIPITTISTTTNEGDRTADMSRLNQESVTTTTASTDDSKSNSANGTDTNSTEDDDGEDEDSDQPASGGSNLMNSAGTNDTSSDSGDGDDSDETDDVQTEQTPTTTLQSGQPTGSGPTTTTTTTVQPPAMTTIDIERLPKQGQKSQKQQQPPSESGKAPSLEKQNNQKQGIQDEDFNRIRKPSSDSNFVMMTLSPDQRTVEDGESSITVPMDTLMRMMMNQLAMDEMQANNDKMQTPVSIMATSSRGSTIQSTEQPTAATRTPAASSTSARLTEQQTTTTTKRPVASDTSATTKAQSKEGQTMVNDIMANGKKIKLQPPPTTKMPTSKPTSDSQEPQNSTPSALVEISTQRTLIDMPSNEMNSASRDKQREPKMEIINMDLMPVQKMMSAQQRPTPARDEMRMSMQMSMREEDGQRGRGEQPTMILDNNNRLVMLEVEPGMRLRPPTGGQQMATTAAAGQPSRNTQANTIYMIMMNPNPSTMSSQEPTAHSKKPPMMQDQQPQMSSTKSPQQPAPVSVSLSTKQTNRPMTMLERLTNQQQPSTFGPPLFMRTSQPTGSTGRASSSRSMITTSGQQQSTTMSPPTASSTATTMAKSMMDNVIEMEQDAKRQPNSVMDMRRLELTSPTVQPMTSSSISMRMRQQMMSQTTRPAGQQASSQATSRAPFSQQETTTSTPVRQSAITTTTTIVPTADTTEKETTSGSGQDSSISATGITPLTTTMMPGTSAGTSTSKTPATSADERITQTTTTANPQQNRQQTGGEQSSVDATLGSDNNQIQFERIQQPATNASAAATPAPSVKRPQASSKTASKVKQTAKTANATSSFIPSKLRMDFNKLNLDTGKQAAGNNKTANLIASQPLPTTTVSPVQAMAQNMAIRQFGGANRMSALANGQPVPFGRPSAMTMQSTSKPTKVDLPTFEYGPSIAVRRPDEPLANGQVPNCTLTGKNFCVLTKDYPMNEVRQAVERSFRSVRIMYEELQTVSDQELHKDDFNATNNQAASGKFACQTQVEMMRPGWAKDEITKGWMLVVNTDVFPQRVRTESCAQPNTPCEFIAPFYDSTCQQRYSLHRMIAIDPHDPSRSPQVAVFKFPAGCVCRVHPIRKSVAQMTAINN